MQNKLLREEDGVWTVELQTTKKHVKSRPKTRKSTHHAPPPSIKGRKKGLATKKIRDSNGRLIRGPNQRGPNQRKQNQRKPNQRGAEKLEKVYSYNYRVRARYTHRFLSSLGLPTENRHHSSATTVGISNMIMFNS